MKKIGIYCLLNNRNNKVYIGSSKDLDKRWDDHFDKLLKGTHANYHLQSEIDEFGIDNLEIVWLEECLEDELLDREDHYINKFGSLSDKVGYNLKSADRTEISESMRKKLSESKKGIKNPIYGTKRSLETRKRISATMKGIKRSDSTKSKISNSMLGERHPRAKLNAEKVRRIKLMLVKGNWKRKDIAMLFDVSFHTIADIELGRCWNHLNF